MVHPKSSRLAAAAAAWACACVLVLAASPHPAAAKQPVSAKAYEQLGFTGLQSCADCDVLGEYVKDEELVADCKRHCVEDKAADDAIYTSAKLVVCPFKLNGLPAISDFIQKHAVQYSQALTVHRQMGAYPKLVLSNKSGARTSVRIDLWKVPTIHEYLQGKLEGFQGAGQGAAKVQASKKKA